MIKDKVILGSMKGNITPYLYRIVKEVRWHRGVRSECYIIQRRPNHFTFLPWDQSSCKERFKTIKAAEKVIRMLLSDTYDSTFIIEKGMRKKK